MTKGGKSGVVSDASKGEAVAEQKGKRSHFRTRVGMDFDPRTTKLHNQKDVRVYLTKYSVHLSLGIEVEFCPKDTDFILPLPNGGVYITPRFWR